LNLFIIIFNKEFRRPAKDDLVDWTERNDLTRNYLGLNRIRRAMFQ